MSRTKNFPTSLSNPIDRTARKVVSKGQHFNPQTTNKLRQTWETPPEVITPIPDAVKLLINQRKGNLVVVGYLGKSASQLAKLLVRCDCGKYEARIAIRWRKHSGENNFCHHCEYVERLKTKHLPDEVRAKERERIKTLRQK